MVEFEFGANWRRPYGRANIRGMDDHPVVHVAYRDVEAYAPWAGKEFRPKPNGNSPHAAGSTARICVGR